MAVNTRVAGVITRCGGEAQRRRSRPEFPGGLFIAASFGLSEPHAGSDAGALRTTARRDGHDYVINGSKQWITSGDQAGGIIVLASTRHPGSQGIRLFFWQGGTQGHHGGRLQEKTGLSTSSHAPSAS